MKREEAIQILETQFPHDSVIREALATVIPEFQVSESEDERIRKWLTDLFSNRNEKFAQELDNYRGLVTREQILAYLEKQKEQKPVMGNGISEQTKMNETVYKFTPEEWKKALDEQLPKEQKPVDDSDFKTKLAEHMMKNRTGYSYNISSESILEIAKEELIKRGELQKPVEWSEEDGWLAGEVLDMIKSNGRWVRSDDAVKQVSNWFNNRFKLLRPQPKQEWSEEDKNFINELCNLLASIAKNNYVGRYYAPDFVNKLQSLRPQHHWKPSEEQMDSLRDTIVQTKGYSYSMYLSELYEQLKKLM